MISLVTVPVVSVLLAITLVGIPVSIVTILIGYTVYVLAGFIAAFFIGRIVLMKYLGERRGWALATGLAIFYVAGFLPYIGQLLRLIATVFAIGGIVLSYRHPEIYETKHLDRLSKMNEFKNVKVFQKSRRLKKQKRKTSKI
jgi:uncharacterized membrane protein